MAKYHDHQKGLQRISTVGFLRLSIGATLIIHAKKFIPDCMFPGCTQ